MGLHFKRTFNQEDPDLLFFVSFVHYCTPKSKFGFMSKSVWSVWRVKFSQKWYESLANSSVNPLESFSKCFDPNEALTDTTPDGPKQARQLA